MVRVGGVLVGAFGLLLGCATAPPPAVQISSAVHGWFALLEARTIEPPGFERYLEAPSFELDGGGERSLGVPELRARHRELHEAYVSIEHRIDELRVEPIGEDLHTAHFRVERHALDVEGIPHIQRKQVSWRVRTGAGGSPVILRIDEQPLLPHPGSGTRIVCY